MSVYRGYSLINLLLGLALSTLLLMIVWQFYSQIQRQNQRLFLQLQLQLELEQVMQTMAKDIRRAGFKAPLSKATESNFYLFELEDAINSIALHRMPNAVKNNCVLFFYDLDANGCLGSTKKNCVKNHRSMTTETGRELFGYRQKGKFLESRSYGNKFNARCTGKECQRYLQAENCQDSGWRKILDEDIYEVTKLEFSWLENSANYPAVEIYLAARLKHAQDLQYETSLVVPLLNQKLTK